jgi:hypothetical protein
MQLQTSAVRKFGSSGSLIWLQHNNKLILIYIHMKAILFLLFVVLIFTSCEKEEIESIKLEEIIYPLEAPSTNTNSSVEPRIRVRNNGDITISSFAINYNVDINNTNGGYIAGPIKTYFANLKPNKDTVLILDKWETYPTNHFPLQNGTHMLLIKVYQINGKPFQNEDKYFVKRLFVLQE